MRVQQLVIAITTASAFVAASPVPSEAAEVELKAKGNSEPEPGVHIDWSILEDHEVIELDNGVKFLGPPITPNKAARARRALETRQTADSCGDSSFEGVTSGGSPTVNDCAVIQNTAYNVWNTWWETHFCGNVWNSKPATCYNPIAWYGTCLFGAARKYSGTGNYDGAVGSRDIGDLIKDSINKFQSGGRVGSRGEMKCRLSYFGDPAHYTATIWGLYHY
ncbi:hypothetical protein NM208_g2155 [Fusarium decemcellulare]|uniref:Uncharacterized protein n=1 Tax=Fusarium decemcellulare TaxID=57161 RepID=A0ACC1STN7_9HYPO|nr:hypothetical protein NM208_g2155 [Fusarium decemcellulare]